MTNPIGNPSDNAITNPFIGQVPSDVSTDSEIIELNEIGSSAPSQPTDNEKMQKTAKELAAAKNSPSVLRSVAKFAAFSASSLALLPSILFSAVQATVVGATMVPGLIGGALVSPLTFGASLLIRSIQNRVAGNENNIFKQAKEDTIKSIEVSAALTGALPAAVVCLTGLVKSAYNMIPFILIQGYGAASENIQNDPAYESLNSIWKDGSALGRLTVDLLKGKKIDSNEYKSWSLELILKPFETLNEAFNKPPKQKQS